MASHDASSESHTGTTGSIGEASFTWNHAGASSGVKGIVVKVYNTTSASDFATSVTCGGVDVPAVVGGFAQDTAGEAGSCKVFFLGTSVPQGTNAIVVNRTNNAAELYATAATILGSNDTEVTGVALEQGDQALAEENVDDGSPGTNSVRYAGTYSGAANITAALLPGANSTLIGAIDVGGNCAMSVVETTPGQGSRPVGFVAASDDVAAVYLAVREVAGGGTPHTATQTDPEGLLDSAAQVTDSARPFTDPLGLLDAAAQVTDSVRSQSDPLGLLDSVSYEQSGGTDKTVTDPFGLIDAAAQVTDSARSFTDPLSLLDSAAQVADSVRSQTDPLGLLDDVTYDLSGVIVRTVTDPLGLVDDGQWDAVGPDPLGLTDSITAVQGHGRDLTDPLGLLDDASYNVSGGVAHTATITDALGLTDVTVTVADSVRTQIDTLGLIGATTFGLGQTVTVTDGLGLLDSATYVISVDVIVTDGLGLTDTATTTADYVQTITDLLGLTDSVSSAATGATFWTPDPTAYVSNPAGYTANPAAYVPVEAGDTPPSW